MNCYSALTPAILLDFLSSMITCVEPMSQTYGSYIISLLSIVILSDTQRNTKLQSRQCATTETVGTASVTLRSKRNIK